MSSHLRFAASVFVVASFSTSPIIGQAPKIGLLPGYTETSSTWYSAYSTLYYSGLQLGDIFRPGLPTESVFQSQYSWLGTNYGSSVGSNTILIGHSNGGIVARYASQQQSLLGTATIAAPNHGVPLITNEDELLDFFAEMVYDVGVTAADFLVGDNYWLYDNTLAALWTAVSAAEFYVGEIIDNFVYSSTVTAQDVVDSGFLDDTLNASGRVTTELANAGTSIAVVVTADNYYDGGPVRWAADAGDAEDFSTATAVMGAAALSDEAWIVANDYPLTAQNYTELNDLDIVATILFDYELVFCAGITDPHYSDPWTLTCDDNDTFLGVSRQARPSVSGANVVAWAAGPRHIDEPYEGGRIESLLHNSFGISY